MNWRFWTWFRKPDESESEPDITIYEPQPLMLSDGDFVIFDPDEFADNFTCWGATLCGGVLWVLDRETLALVKIEPAKPEKPEKTEKSIRSIK